MQPTSALALLVIELLAASTWMASADPITTMTYDVSSSTPAPSTAGIPIVKVGMSLEAVDLLNPELICVASIKTIDENGRWLITFDGWTNFWDYWTSPQSSVDIFPVGFMEYVKKVPGAMARLKQQRNMGNLNEHLQKPYRSSYSEDPFPWKAYFEDMLRNNTNAIATPVPLEAFAETSHLLGFPVGGSFVDSVSTSTTPTTNSQTSDTTSAAASTTTSEAVTYPVYEGLTVGMSLEAIDVHYPSMVCVASIKAIGADGRWLITFDGWGASYDYWASPYSKEIFPCGFMEYIGKSDTNLAMLEQYRATGDITSTLYPPLGSSYPNNPFPWRTYFQDVNTTSPNSRPTPLIGAAVPMKAFLEKSHLLGFKEKF